MGSNWWCWGFTVVHSWWASAISLLWKEETFRRSRSARRWGKDKPVGIDRCFSAVQQSNVNERTLDGKESDGHVTAWMCFAVGWVCRLEHVLLVEVNRDSAWCQMVEVGNKEQGQCQSCKSERMCWGLKAPQSAETVEKFLMVKWFSETEAWNENPIPGIGAQNKNTKSFARSGDPNLCFMPLVPYRE